MELYHLRYFLMVAETEHLTLSAERLHIAQPSLTKVMHNLEAELGVPLFIHKGRRIVLSEYGQFLRDRLVPLMRELDGLPDELRSMMQDGSETIRLNVLAASSFTGRNEVYLSDVAAERFISLSESRDFRGICDKLCRAYGFHPDIFFESDSPSVVIGMISSGFGVGFWPEFTWGAPCENVTLLPIADVGFSRCLVISDERTAQNPHTGRFAADFFNFLRDYCTNSSFCRGDENY